HACSGGVLPRLRPHLFHDRNGGCTRADLLGDRVDQFRRRGRELALTDDRDLYLRAGDRVLGSGHVRSAPEWRRRYTNERTMVLHRSMLPCGCGRAHADGGWGFSRRYSWWSARPCRSWRWTGWTNALRCWWRPRRCRPAIRSTLLMCASSRLLERRAFRPWETSTRWLVRP